MDRRHTRRRSASRREASETASGRLLELRIEKVVAEGDGLGRDSDGKVVFVEGALPGELVVARVTAESKDYSRARVERILEAHEQRVTPPCPHVEQGCGGCDLQHASEGLQLDIKRQIVHESLRRLAGIAAPDVRVSPHGAQESAKRTTVRVAAVDGTVGFRKRRSNDVIAIEECLVAHPRINDVMSKVSLSRGAEAVIRVSTTTHDAVVWTEPEDHLLSDDLGQNVRTGAQAQIRETVAGVELQVSAASFFQSSPAAASGVVEAVSRAVGPSASWPSGTVVDAYGGVGLFSATLVPADRHVVVVELNPSSCADARVNLAGHHADIVSSRVEDWPGEPAGIVIADPARDGLRARAVEVLTACRPEIFVLVSCDPASLGRDARLLAAAGYRLDYCEVIDAFAHTHHVESVSRFVRSEMAEVP